MKFIGRSEYIESLNSLFNQPKSNLVVIRGRRRVGKSRLAKEIGVNKRFLQFSGIAPEVGVSAQDQRNSFANQLSHQLSLPQMIFHDWEQVFVFLNKQIKEEQTVILLDEISWMGSKDPTFLPKLKNAWDLLFQEHNNLLLILCGSVSTWIEKNIINSTAFFGRISRTIILEPLSIRESHEFLVELGFKNSAHEFFKILSVFGGVPWYLEQLNPAMSADQNIKTLCFRKNSPLSFEFDRIFYDIFSTRGEIYKKIMERLALQPLSQKQLLEKINYSRSGSISKYLEDLILCGFISKYHSWSLQTLSPTKQALYKVTDPYIVFYYKYLKPNLSLIQKDNFKNRSLVSLAGWNSIVGLQIENLVINNIDIIYKKLCISHEDIVADGPFIQKSNKTRRGCQIDYLVQLRQHELFLIEIKFSLNAISMDVVKQLENKIERLDMPKTHVIKPVLIHVNGVVSALKNKKFIYRIINLQDILSDL